jgi:hypothetical protein
MALRDAVIRAGVIPTDQVEQKTKKRYSEMLSHELAIEVADGLRARGFAGMKPLREIVKKGKNKGKIQIRKEKEFQGGLGPKRVDVSFSDDRHGLMLAVTIKCLNFPSYPKISGSDPAQFDYSGIPNFSKNIKNRFGDLTTEAITLHLRFPFAVVGCLYVMPERSMTERGSQMKISTFERASHLYGTITGRRIYGDPAEKFEDVTLLLHRPLKDPVRPEDVWVRLYQAGTGMKEISESSYFQQILNLYNDRNPHAMIGEDADEGEIEFEDINPEGAVETEEE